VDEKKSLPSEVVSLIHHIELNKTGWREKALQKLIIGILWLSKEPLTINQICDNMFSNYLIKLDLPQLQSYVDILSKDGAVIEIHGNYKLTESYLEQLKKDKEQVNRIEIETKNLFIDLLKNVCPSLPADETWLDFNNTLLIPSIHEMGARSYELISHERLHIDRTKISDYLAKYPTDKQVLLTTVISLFFDQKDDNVRKYILCNLQAYFLLQACHLKEDIINKFVGSGDKPRFDVFTDTNFLLSILELHENPFNDAAQYLIRLTDDIKDKVEVNYFCLPLTYDETREVIAYNADILKDIRYSQNIVDGIISGNVPISSIAMKYLKYIRDSGNLISPSEYFEPYINNLEDILESKNVHYWSDTSFSVNNYSVRQDVIDDISDRLDYERARYGYKAKSYKNLKHDVILWHYVYEKRNIPTKTHPVDTRFWIVTLDYRYLSFDRYKNRNALSPIPICVHPVAFIQYLQFWVGLTPQLEEAVMISFKWLFLGQEFSAEAEKVTIRILETLTRYEKALNLPVDTVKKILLNETLRGKLSYNVDIENEIDNCVQEALVDENIEINKKLEVEKTEQQKLIELIKVNEQELQQIRESLIEEKTGQQKLQDDVKLKEQDLQKIKEQYEKLEHENLERKSQNEKLKENNLQQQFIIFWVMLPLAFIIVIGLLLSKILLNYLHIFEYWQWNVILIGILFILYLALLVWKGSGIECVNRTTMFKNITKFKNLCFTIIGVAILLAIENELSSFIQKIITAKK
jgi:hypothetical protein